MLVVVYDRVQIPLWDQQYLDHYADHGTEGKGYVGFPRPDRIVKSVLGETMLGKEPLYLCLDINT